MEQRRRRAMGRTHAEGKYSRAITTRNLLIATALATLCFPHVSLACDYYASPNGGGNGLSQSSPFKVSSFWPNASSGKTLCLLDGTYTGQDSMIDPGWNYPSVSGSSGNPITVRALNDGKVWIDGQFSRRPVYLSNNKWFVLEGFNAYNGSDKVVVIGSSNVTIRRVIAWNVSNSMSNADETFLVAGPNNTVEDCAAWGTGRKVLSGVQTGNDVVFRRCWVRFEEHPLSQVNNNPDTSVELGYNALRQTFENIIGTWDESGGGAFNEPEGVFRTWGTNGQTLSLNSKVLGSIGYVRSGDTVSTRRIFQADHASNLEYNHVVSFVQPGASGTVQPFFFEDTPGATGLKISNSVGIGAASSSIPSQWQKTNFRQGNSVAAAIGTGKNLFQEVPGICYRYQNGVLSSTPLWPWPMDQRIYDAMVRAGKTPITVTQTIESMFGAIPSVCKSSGGGQDTQSPANPLNLRMSSQ
jgi:hypothetical protein